jgi:hypothetical protein
VSDPVRDAIRGRKIKNKLRARPGRPTTVTRTSLARLSPLKHKNLNVLGRYSFTATQPAGGTMRPLRDLDAAGLDDDGPKD